ncbi:MAG TPA: alpha-amylase family glycosyl hydrolase [Longimicrobiales bacterium]
MTNARYPLRWLLPGLIATLACASTQTSPDPQTSWISAPALYEVFTRDFSPEGSFAGVIAGLDRIQASGADVISLMPIHPDYGTEADLRRLVEEVHRRGMRIIIDWTDVADLNYRDPGQRAAMIADMKYWLDRYNLDGFRVDAPGLAPDDFWREALPALRANRRPILLLAKWADPKLHALGFDLSYGSDGYGKLKAVWQGEPAASFVDEREVEEQLPNNGRRLRFTTNHDETVRDQLPPVVFGGAAGARAAFVAMAFMPGVPMLYNGQEVESPQKLGLYVKGSVQSEHQPGDEARAFYRRVLDLATSHPAFTGGELQPVITDAPRDVISYARGDVLVLVNTRPREIAVNVHGKLLDGSRDLIYGNTHHGSTVRLGAYGTAVLDPMSR